LRSEDTHTRQPDIHHGADHHETQESPDTRLANAGGDLCSLKIVHHGTSSLLLFLGVHAIGR
jgi:hypothetical protein